MADFSLSTPLNYVDGTLWQAVRSAAERFSRLIAYDFMGKSTSYRQFAREVEQCAKALISLGVRPGDRVTVCLPNCPQAVVLFYAVNAVGGVANMVHPLSGEKEIEFFLRESESKIAVTLDQFYGKFAEARRNVSLDTLIITSIKDALSVPMKIGYAFTEQKKIPKLPNHAPILSWNDFLKRGDSAEKFGEYQGKTDDPAVILYSG
ncbi:MAG: AMP-binding protein, partial [Clostridia bacterium]|nr:AMP-binding protein [Clostridia bacterium]